MSLKTAIIKSWDGFNNFCNFLKPIGDLFIRYWVAKAFFMSGFVKVQSWSATMLLYQFEYHVPFLSPDAAAYISVGIELVMSAFLILGLGGRIPALILFLFNIVAVLSYPFLWTQAGYVGLKDHICWGLLLMILVLHGPGRFSLDHYIHLYFRKKKT